ncbi:DUF456 domain-containing protein [Halalkalibacterium ligniniphilum]|uniref:DUF456 domain-containing protein n=1 Tax=Halalkalibacterium ligniniphilum TaxID=1134413 RepID=UPI00034A94B4|nr:DUF456 domain-containing protein [Halalkalibacterium ligniniphilum]
MLTTFIWILIVILFILSFVGLVFPIIPSILVLWAGFLLYLFGIGGELSFWFWLGMVVLTVLIVLSDLIANSYFVKRYGGSKWAERVAAIGVIVGSFVMPPFGIILVPFLAVFVTEWLIQKDISLALKIGVASFVAFLSSTLAKLVIQFVMIGWFLVEAIF